MKNSNDTIRNRTSDLPTCSAVPQPTALPRAPQVWLVYCYELHVERQAFGYTVRISIYGTSRTKGLRDIIIFWLLEHVVPIQLICHFMT